jgi:dihydrolipoamide dehydrogenase
MSASTPYDYDVIVLGAGPAGYVCAIRASQLGLKAAVVEREWLGGVCLNVGCIPSKALLRNAELVQILLHRGPEFGFEVKNPKVDYAVAVKRSRQVSAGRVKGVEFLLRKNKIDVHRGVGRLSAPDRLEVTAADGTVTGLRARNIVLATGARASLLPGMKVDGKKILTYREAILQETLPSSVTIVGAGPVGLEFATLWSSYGTRVTLVEMLPRIAPLEDEEISTELSRAFKRSGIEMRTGTRVEAVETGGEKVRLSVSAQGKAEDLEADQVLVATGFQPNSEGLGLEGLGVKLEKGRVEVDERMATNVSGLWAIGDVTGRLMLAHVGSAMGIVCAENIAGVASLSLNYEMMPRGIFSRPQVASFGLTEAQARERGYEVRVGRFPLQANGKAQGLGDAFGFVKILAEARYGELLGAHLIGAEVTELLPELTLAQAMELTAEQIAHNVHLHPTLSETLMEAAHGLVGGYIDL